MSQSKITPLLGFITAVALVLLAALGLVVYGTHSAFDRVNHEARRLRAFELRVCERLNVTRASDNESHLADYLVDQSVVKLFALANPHDESSAARRVSATVQTAVRHKTWTPLTDCQDATRHNNQTARTQAVQLPEYRFVDRLPPASEQSIQNAEKPNPVGSVR